MYNRFSRESNAVASSFGREEEGMPVATVGVPEGAGVAVSTAI